MTKIYFFLIAIFFSQSASAGYISGNKLNEWCEAGGGLRIGYILATIDTVEAISAQEDSGTRQFCIPEGVTGGQVIEIACNYLKLHPENRHKNASALVLRAFVDSFPCEAEE